MTIRKTLPSDNHRHYSVVAAIANQFSDGRDSVSAYQHQDTLQLLRRPRNHPPLRVLGDCALRAFRAPSLVFILN